MLGSPKNPADATRRSRAPRLEQLEVRDVPAIFATGDVYTTPIGQVLATTATQGVLANDFSDTFPGQLISAAPVGLPTYVGNVQPLPNKSLNLNPDGSFTFLTPNQIPTGVTQVQFTYQATNTNGELATGVATINIVSPPTKLLAVGAEAGGGPHVRVFESGTGFLKFNFFPYEQSFTGGVRVAVGDLNNDNVEDVIVVPASGGSVRLQAYNGIDGSRIVDQFVFNPDFRGGGYVAVGDFNGDNQNDIIVGAGEGGGPRVTAIAVNPVTFATTTLSDFFAFDSSMNSGVRVAAGDFQRLGRDFVVTAPGAGGGPVINVFDGQQVLSKANAFPVLSFVAGDPSNREGVFIATGNLRGDGLDDIVTGSGSGNGIVRVFDGRNAGLIREFAVPFTENATGTGTVTAPSTFSSQAFSGSLLSPSSRPTTLVNGTAGSGSGNSIPGGARVAAGDYNRDGLDDIIVGNGPGSAPRVRVFSTNNGTELTSILAFSPTFLGGVNVGAN